MESAVFTMKAEKRQSGSSFDRRLKALADMAVEMVNILAERKIDGAEINVADIYYVLSKALQHVSMLNLAEIEDYKVRRQSNKLTI